MDFCASRKSPERLDPAMMPEKWREDKQQQEQQKLGMIKKNKC